MLQKYDNVWLPVAFTSIAMTSTEIHYVQIEKEALAMTFACDWFDQYIYGHTFHVETDHKPLVAIFTKSLSDCPARIQRFQLKLQKYDFEMSFTLSKNMQVADAL